MSQFSEAEFKQVLTTLSVITCDLINPIIVFEEEQEYLTIEEAIEKFNNGFLPEDEIGFIAGTDKIKSKKVLLNKSENESCFYSCSPEDDYAYDIKNFELSKAIFALKSFFKES